MNFSVKFAGLALAGLFSAGVAAAELGEAQPGEPGVASLDELWQLLIRAAVLWYAAFAVWILLL